jgi:hypothetical protein
LNLELEAHPLGFPFKICSNSQLPLDAARRSFGCFSSRFRSPRIEARLIVADNGPATLPEPPVFRAQHHLLAIVSDAANFAMCDLQSGFAFGCIGPAAAADPGFLSFYFLEAIAYTLLGQLCVTPIHASCVACGRTGVLLCGAAGAGKSTLAYACARRGWTLISDNASYLLDSGGRTAVAGRPQSVRFGPGAADFFPELDEHLNGDRINGKNVLDLSTARPPGVSTGFDCEVSLVVFLSRRAGAGARMSPISEDEAFQRFLSETARFRDEVELRQRQSILNLVRTGVFELEYEKLEDAIDELERRVTGK